MSARLDAALEGRRLALQVDGAARLTLALDQGGRHRLVVADAETARRAVAVLEACPGVGVLTAAGSLPGAMTVAESLSLVLRYAPDEIDPDDDERELETALRLCGLPPERIATLGEEQPMKLGLQHLSLTLTRKVLLARLPLLLQQRSRGKRETRQRNSASNNSLMRSWNSHPKARRDEEFSSLRKRLQTSRLKLSQKL